MNDRDMMIETIKEILPHLNLKTYFDEHFEDMGLFASFENVEIPNETKHSQALTKSIIHYSIFFSMNLIISLKKKGFFNNIPS